MFLQHMFRRAGLGIAAFAVGAMAVSVSLPARAQSYPTKPITLLIPFAPGAVDVFIRAIAPALEAELGQPIVIENRPGANGAVAAEALRRAAPDGYTLLMAPSSLVATRFVNKDVTFDPCNDFAAVSSIHESPMVLAVYPGLGIKSVKDLVEQAKRTPGKLTFGSAGIGSVMHLNAEVFKNASGTDLTHVPYKGAAVFIPDLITGRLDMAFSTLATLAPQIDDKKLVAVAILDNKPLEAMPGVPAINDSLPNFRKVTAFSTIVGPKGLPDQIRTRLHQATEKVLKRDDTKTIFDKNKGLIFSTKSPDEVQRIVCAERDLIGDLTKKIGIQPQ
jgi:tripartite-type tricarboxylate transporter receptor subunit TctC